jgi:hypothetical protein
MRTLILRSISRPTKTGHWLICLLALFALASPVTAAEVFGRVDALSGTAFRQAAEGGEQALQEGSAVYAGDTLMTRAESEVHIATIDHGLIALRPNSQLRIDTYRAAGAADDGVAMSLLKGALRSITGLVTRRQRDAYSIRVATATIGVRGTDHETTWLEAPLGDDPAGIFESVNEGITVLRTEAGEIEVHPGQDAFSPSAGDIPPRLLARRPGFLRQRLLRLEQRLQQRKDTLRELILQRLDNAEGGGDDERLPDIDLSKLTPDQREALKRRLLQQRRLRDRRTPG